MGKKKKPDFSRFRIFILIGAGCAALAALILAFLYWTSGQKKKKDNDDQEPGQEVESGPSPDNE